MGGANNCTTCENLTLADLAVLSIYQRQIDHLILGSKEGFFVGYVEKGARSFVGKK